MAEGDGAVASKQRADLPEFTSYNEALEDMGVPPDIIQPSWMTKTSY